MNEKREESERRKSETTQLNRICKKKSIMKIMILVRGAVMVVRSHVSTIRNAKKGGKRMNE